MSLITILRPKEVVAHRMPPVLTSTERRAFFRLTPETRSVVAKMRSSTSRAGFLLQLGYFRASGRFFACTHFHKRDVDHVTREFRLHSYDTDHYSDRQSHRHRDQICALLHWRRVDDKERNALTIQAAQLVENQESPRNIFQTLKRVCWRRQWVIPTYSELAAIITASFNYTEQRCLHMIQNTQRLNDTQALEELLQPIEEPVTAGHKAPLTTLKKIDQSMEVRATNQSAKTLALFRDHFFKFAHLYDALSISDKAVEYYASWLTRARHQQATAFPDRNKTYLHLLCFIKHQFYKRQDHAVDTLLKKTRHADNAARKAMGAISTAEESERIEAIESLRRAYLTDSQFTKAALAIIEDQRGGPEERLHKLDRLAEDYRASSDHDEDTPDHSLLDRVVDRYKRRASYYDALEGHAGALRRCLSSTLVNLVFDGSSKDKDILDAIDRYKQQEGRIGANPPTAFLRQRDLEAVMSNGELNIDLYEVLLYLAIANRIRSNHLNLMHSFRFRAIQDFLIPLSEWRRDRTKILRETGLSQYKDINKLLAKLKKHLNERFDTVNSNLKNGHNSHYIQRADGSISVRTPRTDFDQSSYISATLNARGIVPIFDVLKAADRYCKFTDCFEHFSNKHSKMQPTPETVLAGVLGRGCNIGVSKLARISTGLSSDKLRNAVNWCFTDRNVQAANHKVTQAIRELTLSKQFVTVDGQTHSSSDGRKVVVSVDSIASAYSYKYFGQEQGVTDYCFIDDRQVFFHALVFTATDRDAPYVLDGLVDNNETKAQVHSTDTHGFTEQLFGASYLMGITFAPRIAKPHRYALYGFSEKRTHEKLGYPLRARTAINQKRITSQWDDLLRFIATIKTHRSSASQLFKRLSSYAREHPLYKALKEFGRIIKTQFLLTYFDDVELRKRIQKQLNTAEQGQKFSRAVFFDNDQAFRHGTLEEQKAAVDCRILLQNCIVLWN